MKKLEKQLIKAQRRLDKLKEQAEKLKNANCPASTIEMIEPGKWYKVKSINAVFYLEEIKDDKKCKGYGFLDGEWYDDRKTNNFMGFATEIEIFVEATHEQVKEALIREAKKRYNIGDILGIVNQDYSKGKRTFSNDLTASISELKTELWVDSYETYACIFYNGTWADVVVPEKEPKIGEICKFWDYDKESFSIGKLASICDGLYYKYLNINNEKFYMSCEPLDPNMTLGEVFGKEGDDDE